MYDNSSWTILRITNVCKQNIETHSYFYLFSGIYDINPENLKSRSTGLHRKQKRNIPNNIEEGAKELKQQLKDTIDRKCKVEHLRTRSMWRRTIGYPLMMVLITALTAASLISVVKNVGQIVAGFKSLPAVNQVSH